MNFKGIILSGGTGTRLGHLTKATSKQLLPIFDKPMIFYPLSVLMLAGIKDIAIITNPEHLQAYKKLLKGVEKLGVNLTYVEQEKARGLSEAYLLCEDFLGGSSSMMLLGDNIFYGSGLSGLIQATISSNKGASIFGYRVMDPERYGIAEINDTNQVVSIEEKPKNPKSNLAITGLYIFDGTAPKRAKLIEPSSRGELEITDLIKSYLNENNADLTILPRGIAWLDTGTPESLLEASQFVHTVQQRQGLFIACLEEIAFKNKWISETAFRQIIDDYHVKSFKEYLLKILHSSEKP